MIPVCNRCQREHYRFVRCTNVDAWNERHSAVQQARKEPPLDLSVPAGFRPWGDRLQTWERTENVYYRKDSDEGPQEAA